MTFACDIKQVDSFQILVRVGGALDAGTSIELDAKLSPYLANPQTQRVVFNFAALTFLSSSGLRIVMMALKAVMPRGGKVSLSGVQPQIMSIIKLAGIAHLIEFKESGFNCDVTAIDATQVLVTVTGALDAGTAIELDVRLNSFLSDPNMRRVIFDLRSLLSLSSSGLRIFVMAVKAMKPRNGRVCLVGVQPQVMAIIKMAGIANFLEFRDR